MAKKKSNNKSISNKQADAQRRRDKKQNKNKENSYDPEMKCQLEKIGLGLKDIPGDGNCLFRALADQLYGGQEGQKLHGRLRNETVKYMLKNKEDFEPFFASDEGLTFDRHLDLLSEDGTYAGNDAIVAFARRYEVVVVIHQLNEALWKIGEEKKSTTPTSSSEKEKAELHNSKPAKHYQDREPAKSNKSLSKRMKQLHISYHNGDHYNSVRRIGDFGITGGGAANKPANVYIDTLKPDIQVDGSTSYNSDDNENSQQNHIDVESEDKERLSDSLANKSKEKSQWKIVKSRKKGKRKNGYCEKYRDIDTYQPLAAMQALSI